MKKIYSLLLVAFMFIGMLGVNATTLDNDNNNNIDFPAVYQSGAKVEIIGVSSYELYYQVIKVEDGVLSTAIDNYYKTQIKLDKISDKTSEEYLTLQSELNTYKNEIKNNAPDYNSSNWKEATDRIIYNSTDVTNTSDGKYIVWVKLLNKANNETITDFNFYSFSDYGSITTNPETGVENFGLYLGVAILVLTGSILVFRKNKEIYN